MKRLISVFLASAVVFSGSALAGDAAAGKDAFASKGCVGCHGADGNSVVPNVPNLKGRDAAFVKKNLTDFKSGARQGTTMNAMAAGLSEADIENLAAYIATL